MKNLLFTLFWVNFSVNAQQVDKIKAFLDCSWYCDNKYIQTEIPYVDFIREPKDAYVHILVTRNTTGSGGDLFTFKFIGQGEFANAKETLRTSLSPDATEDEIRIAQVKTLKSGLYNFVKHSKENENISLVYSKNSTETTNIQVEDPWKYWIFRLSANGRFNGEEGYKSKNYSIRFSANKITKDIKLESSIYMSQSKSVFDYDDFNLSTIQKNSNANILAVKSINEHFSAGAFTNYKHSTYSNIEHGFAIMPALEYNIFPYSEASEHQLRFLYGIGNQHNNYIDTTIFFKTYENYFFQQLSLDFEIIQKWGSLDLGINAKDFFLSGHKYDVGVFLNVNIRIVKGLSVSGFGNFNLNRSQIELPSSGANYEEVILRQKELASGFDYYTYLGLTYTFGSLYNNIVNTRFD